MPTETCGGKGCSTADARRPDITSDRSCCPTYSSIACVAGNCLLRNVCVDVAQPSLSFHSGPAALDVPLLGLHTHEHLDDLHTHPGGTTRASHRMLRVRKLPGYVNWSHYPHGWHSDAVHVVINRVVPQAPAHTLADEVVGIFQGLEMWGLLAELSALSVWVDDTRLAHPYQALASRVTVRERSLLPRGACLRQLLVGWTSTGFMKGTQSLGGFLPTWTETKTNRMPKPPSLYLLRFRDHAWRRYGIVPRTAPHALHVLLINKNASHSMTRVHIANSHAITAALVSPRWAHVLGDGVQVTSASWQGMPMHQQVATVAHVDIVLSLTGSDLLNCVFLPSPAAMIVPWRPCCAYNGYKSGYQPSVDVELWFGKVPRWYVYEYNPTIDVWRMKAEWRQQQAAAKGAAGVTASRRGHGAAASRKSTKASALASGGVSGGASSELQRAPEPTGSKPGEGGAPSPPPSPPPPPPSPVNLSVTLDVDMLISRYFAAAVERLRLDGVLR